MATHLGVTPAVWLIIAILATATEAQAQQVGNVQQGLKLARDECAQCHLVVKAVGRSTNPDAPTFEAIAKTPGMTSTALTAALLTSHHNMPNIVIKGDDLNAVIAYILSLKEKD